MCPTHNFPVKIIKNIEYSPSNQKCLKNELEIKIIKNIFAVQNNFAPLLIAPLQAILDKSYIYI